MTEISMTVEYRDHLAYTCSASEMESMNGLAWKIDKRDW